MISATPGCSVPLSRIRAAVVLTIRSWLVGPHACEHAFVTSEGHAHARFRRALLSKNLKLIEAASRELPHVGLDDALRVLVVFAERRDARYERAATRFAARVMLERRLGLAEARYVLALAEALPRSPDAVAVLLRPYCA
jgi:hypothetical protein